MENEKTIQKGDELELTIEDLAFGGQGVARVDKWVVFVERTLPGQKIRARIVKKRKNYLQAHVTALLSPSPHQIAPECAHFGDCGGCLLQNLDYSQQLAAKTDQVVDALQRLGGFRDVTVDPIIPSRELYFYRNKMEFSFSRSRWLTPCEIASGADLTQEGLFLGLHAKGFYDKIIDIVDCRLIDPLANEIVDAVREFARQSGLPAYSTRDHNGFYRFLVLRRSKRVDEWMVNLITRDYNDLIVAEFTRQMTQRFPQITSLLMSTTASKAAVAFSEQETVLAGKSTIDEKIGDWVFEISSNSFFQTNSMQAAVLYEQVRRDARLTGGENVYDLYCGAGTISIFMSRDAARVTGFEAIPSAVNDAQRNCVRNRVDNCEFVAGDLKDLLADTDFRLHQHGKPDVMIIDPPRSGMHSKTVEAILQLAPQRIVHVSCNPTTLARDLQILCRTDYQLLKVTPVDMFPHTAHIEAVAVLERKTS
ncbi:23S rRNA (uracil(1939)-C(5))-methyltransferase RlmD [candidate division KSB1 bacterium]|nr:23S rRNA (uracil(1939)-C(5))-methyltransferase RlmD [candidate division KSB1 bacterium]